MFAFPKSTYPASEYRPVSAERTGMFFSRRPRSKRKLLELLEPKFMRQRLGKFFGSDDELRFCPKGGVATVDYQSTIWVDNSGLNDQKEPSAIYLKTLRSPYGYDTTDMQQNLITACSLSGLDDALRGLVYEEFSQFMFVGMSHTGLSRLFKIAPRTTNSGVSCRSYTSLSTPHNDDSYIGMYLHAETLKEGTRVTLITKHCQFGLSNLSDAKSALDRSKPLLDKAFNEGITSRLADAMRTSRYDNKLRGWIFE